METRLTVHPAGHLLSATALPGSAPGPGTPRGPVRVAAFPSCSSSSSSPRLPSGAARRCRRRRAERRGAVWARSHPLARLRLAEGAGSCRAAQRGRQPAHPEPPPERPAHLRRPLPMELHCRLQVRGQRRGDAGLRRGRGKRRHWEPTVGSPLSSRGKYPTHATQPLALARTDLAVLPAPAVSHTVPSEATTPPDWSRPRPESFGHCLKPFGERRQAFKEQSSAGVWELRSSGAQVWGSTPGKAARTVGKDRAASPCLLTWRG